MHSWQVRRFYPVFQPRRPWPFSFQSEIELKQINKLSAVKKFLKTRIVHYQVFLEDKKWRFIAYQKNKFHHSKLYKAVHSSKCGKYKNLLSRFFGQNFVKATHLLINHLRVVLTEKHLGESKFFIFLQCACSSVHIQKNKKKFRETAYRIYY